MPWLRAESAIHQVKLGATIEIILPICCVTGRIAGDCFACGDCDPCLSAHVVPPVVKRLMAERDEFANKYEAAMMECDAAFHQALIKMMKSK